MHAHRHRRRRPLREDGAQRHRVRRHAAHRRGLRPASAAAPARRPAEIADVFAEWNKGELESYLIEITAEVLAPGGRRDRQAARRRHPRPGRREGHRRVDRADRARPRRPGVGHRRGGVRPRRCPSTPSSARRAGDLPGPADGLDGRGRRDAFIEDVRLALYASKIVAYSQGFDEIVAGAERVRLGHRPGRGRRRSGAAAASSAPSSSTASPRPTPRTPTSPALLVAPYFADAVGARAGALAPGRRRPPRSPASRPRRSRRRSSYYDGLRAERLPAALDPGPARLLRRAHLQARRQAGHLPHPVVGRPHRDRGGRHALTR